MSNWYNRQSLLALVVRLVIAWLQWIADWLWDRS
jgi:hypothetical protein